MTDTTELLGAQREGRILLTSAFWCHFPHLLFACMQLAASNGGGGLESSMLKTVTVVYFDKEKREELLMVRIVVGLCTRMCMCGDTLL